MLPFDRDEIQRHMPEDSSEVWPHLPDELCEAYQLLIDLTYTGDASLTTTKGGSSGNKYGRSTRSFVRDHRAYAIKAKVDRYLSQTAAALRRRQHEGRTDVAKRPDEAHLVGVPISTRSAGSAR